MRSGGGERIVRAAGIATLVGIASLLLLGVAELVARRLAPPPFVGWEAGPDSDAYAGFDWAASYFEDLRSANDGFRYEPWSLWKHGDAETTLFNTRNGHRVTWQPPPDDTRESVDVFTFGGSTMYGRESPDHLTLPSQLAQRLAERDDGRRTVVHNYGVSAFTSANELHLLVELLARGERPDVVLFYHGLNDVQTGVAVGSPHFFAEAFGDRLFRSDRMGVREMAAQLASRSQLVALLTGRHRAATWAAPTVEDPTVMRRNADALLDVYAQRVEVARALGREYGFAVLHYWQAGMYETKKPLTDEERSLRTSDTMAAVFDVFAAAERERDFFERHGVIDLRHAFDDVQQTIFVDTGHVTPVGNAAVADAILPSLVETLDARN